jgi:hypothetical protein
MSITLLTTYWNCPNPTRSAELQECLDKNIADPRIDAIVLVTEDMGPIREAPKVRVIRQAQRPTFSDLLQNAPTEGIVVLANSDICFGQGLEQVRGLRDCDALALSRYDRIQSKLVKFHRSDSQDAWIVKAPVKNVYGDFRLGIPGCDNRFAFELQKAGYVVNNTCEDIECIHIHASNVRTYTSVTRVPPPYLQCPPRPLGYLLPFLDTHVISRDRIVRLQSAQIPKEANEPHEAAEEHCSHVVMQNLPLDLAPRAAWTLQKVLHFGISFEAMCKAYRSMECSYEFVPTEPKKTAQSRLKDAARRMRPDLIFMQIQQPGILDRKTCDELRTLSTVINWTGDVRSPIPPWFLELGPHVSATCFSNMNDVRLMTQHNLPSEFLQIGYDDDLYVAGNFSRAGVVFTGNHYGSFPVSQFRLEAVTAMKKTLGPRMKLFGSAWGSLADGNTNTDPKQEIRHLQSCAIAVSISHFQYERYFSDRLLRYMACGPLVLQHWYPGIDKDFTPGEHLVVFHDIPELLTKLEYYLSHPQEARRIAEAGCAHVRANHTQKIRCLEIQAIVNKITSGTAPPS